MKASVLFSEGVEATYHSVSREVRPVLLEKRFMMLVLLFHSFPQDGRREEAFRILAEMKQEGVSPDEKTFRLAIEACG